MPVKMKYPWVGGVLAVAVCGMLCASCGTLQGGGGPSGNLTYENPEEMPKEISYRGGTGMQLKNQPTEKGLKTPVLFSKRAMHGTIELGEGEDTTYSFVFDESRGTGSNIDVLYFDANNNEDLTDDDPLKAKEWEHPNQNRTEFGQVGVNVTAGGVDYVYHLKPTYQHYSSPYVNFTPAGYCKGTVRLGDQEVAVALFDDSTNGRFDDVYAAPENVRSAGTIYGSGDAMVIDLNGDGKFEKEYYDRPEVHHVGKYLPWDGECYEVAIEPHGRNITLTPTTEPCGAMKLGTDGMSVELFGDDGPVKVRSGGGKDQLPAGLYHLYQCSIEGEDERGRAWRAVGRGKWEADPITVTDGKTTDLVAGPPFVAEVIRNKKSSNEFQFSLLIHGQAGEEYSAGNIGPKVGGRPPAPKFKVVDKDGKAVAQGTFEYG